LPATQTENFSENLKPTVPSPVPETVGALAVAAPALRAVPTQTALLPAPEPVARTKSKRKPIDTAWIAPMRDATRRLSRLTLAELELDERVDLARFHAWKFEHHRDEAKANARAAELVGALAELGRTRSHGGFTVGEYVEGLTALMASTKALIRSPWAFKGTIEYGRRDPTPASRPELVGAQR
jgi:hypothetical protein